MTGKEILLLANELNGKLIETHISWVILTEKFAYKIKKPVTFSFLDFSSIHVRKEMCEKELRLNKRLTTMYLSLLEISREEDQLNVEGRGEIIEYGVKMLRQPEGNRLDLKLAENRVGPEDMLRITELLVDFHQQAELVKEKEVDAFVQKRFRDVLVVHDWIQKNLGDQCSEILDRAMNFHDDYLKRNRSFLDERAASGFKKDLHGDLHSQNIFLNENDVVIFDCIEFDDRYRQIDVLSEVAFLFMDLEARGHRDLAECFRNHYARLSGSLKSNKEVELFQYYLSYRANVKIKVNGLRAMQSSDEKELSGLKKLILKYLEVLKNYTS